MDEKKFIREVECLMKAKHKNIVRFLGYCAETKEIFLNYEGKSVMAEAQEKLLCFEYLSKGNLRNYITAGRDTHVLSLYIYTERALSLYNYLKHWAIVIENINHDAWQLVGCSDGS
jgi:serine/threonine protein kinase